MLCQHYGTQFTQIYSVIIKATEMPLKHSYNVYAETRLIASCGLNTTRHRHTFQNFKHRLELSTICHHDAILLTTVEKKWKSTYTHRRTDCGEKW